MPLPIVVLGPAEGGGFVAARLPVAQGDRFRIADPGAEYVWAAAEAANEALHELKTAFNDDGGVVMVFFEEVDPAPKGSPWLGYTGFTGPEPDRIHIVVNRVPVEELRWVVRHEIGHLFFTSIHGHDGLPPWVEGPSERFADAFAGPHPPALGSATLARAFASLMPPADRIQLEPGEAPKTVVDGAITVTNAGATVIIDGTSNMFKIFATGTHSVTGANGTGAAGAEASVTTDLSTGMTVVPAFHGHVLGFGGGSSAYGTPRIQFDRSNGYASSGLVLDEYVLNASVVNTNQTRIATVWHTRLDRTATTLTFRYYVMKEAAL